MTDMPYERVYHPETGEPFDVTPSKASDLVLNKGWTRTPWTRVEAPKADPVVEEVPARGRARGRRRRAVEEAPIEHFGGPAPFVVEDEEPTDESWRG